MLQRIQFFFRSRFFKWLVGSFVLIAALILLCNYWIIKSTAGQLYSDVDQVPANDVALVLGANKTSHWGGENLFFRYRIEAAAALFRAGKIKHIIVSGDNHIREYDEATDMCDALVKLGVPDSCITLDFAGFRTLDSMIRCLKVFGQNKVTVISQRFHNERAVFIGSHYGMDVIGFNAKDVPGQYSLKTRIREYFAKFKAVLDLYILRTEPKFLGPEEKITI